MSKNIIIQEGGTGKQMSVSKIKTDKVGGGTCTWVPEDEVSLGAKSISSNGTYKASDDGKYGFSQVTVNVSGSQGSVNSDGTPNVNPVNPNDPDSKVNPGGPGTSVVGTDPVTGNDYVIGVDSSGNLVTTQVPSMIEITEAPEQTEYSDGDSINYTGLVATLKNNDGSTFTNADYPDGRIPISELSFPVGNADIDETTGGGSTSGLNTSIPKPIICSGQNFFQHVDRQAGEGWLVTVASSGPSDGFVGGSSAKYIIIERESDYDIWVISGESDPVHLTAYMVDGEPNGVGWTHYVRSYTYDEKTVYYSRVSFGKSVVTGVGANYVGGPAVDGESAWTAWYGDVTDASQIVAVKWNSPYDGRTFETNFNVTVDSSGFSDDSGGSGSGGGTGF